jgi:hypothetical protein
VPASSAPALAGSGTTLTPPAGDQVQGVLLGKGTLVYRCSAGRCTRVRTSVRLDVEHGGLDGASLFAGVEALSAW